MTCLNELNCSPCPKKNAGDIDAYFELWLDEDNQTTLVLDTSWNTTCTDLSPAVKGSETITHLMLSPAEKPTALEYQREDYGREGAPDGGVDCIEGDALSRIISMRLLKDVSQTNQIMNGGVYMWDGSLFQPFNLQQFVDDTNKQLANLNTRVTVLEGQMNSVLNRLSNIENRLTNIEAMLQRPAGVPTNTRLTWGNRNVYSDYTNTMNKSYGLFTHNPAQDLDNDQYFS